MTEAGGSSPVVVDTGVFAAGLTARSFPLAERPRLRPIEVLPIVDRGERCLVLRDPADPEVRPIVLSDGAAEPPSLCQVLVPR